MLYKQSASKNKTATVAKSGRYIKLVNSAAKLQMRVFREGQILLDTEVRAGFDIEFAKSFDSIMLISETSQQIEIWVSDNKLSYQAPTAGANNNNSFLFNHFGDIEQLVPFEPERVRLTLQCDTDDIYYGGNGVTLDNGIKVVAGQKEEINGAGEIYVAINKKAKYKANLLESLYSMTSSAVNFIGLTNKALTVIDASVYITTSSDTVKLVYNELSSSVDISDFRFLSQNYNKQNLFLLTKDHDDSVYIYDIETQNWSKIFFGSGLGYLSGCVFIKNTPYIKLGGNSDNYLQDADRNKILRCSNSSGNPRAIYANSSYLYILTEYKLYAFDVNAIPATVDYSSETPLLTTSGSYFYSKFIENTQYIIVSTKSVNARSYLIRKSDNAVVDLGLCDDAFFNSDNVCTIKNGVIREYTDNTITNYIEYTIDNTTNHSSSRVYAAFIDDVFVLVENSEIKRFSANKVKSNAKVKIRALKSNV